MARGNGYGEGELVQLVRKRMRQDDKKQPLRVDDWIRVSSLSYLCAREEVLCSSKRIIRTDTISSDLQVIFEHGHALHWALQNRVMPALGVFYGMWRCAGCGFIDGGQQEPWKFGTFTVKQFASKQKLRPKTCSKCGIEQTPDDTIYMEQTFLHEEFRLSGHIDGFLVIDGLDGMGVLEAKSINPKGASEVRACPKLDHVIQAHCYMWLTGLRWSKILYWDKGGFGSSSIIEHTIEYDEPTIERIAELLNDIRGGIASGVLPARICETRVCDRAKQCEVVKHCFSEM